MAHFGKRVMEPLSTSSPPFPAPSPAGAGASLCAVVTLDGGGRILAANRSAQELWQEPEGRLPGRSFAELFAFEVVSREPDFLAAQWDVLLAGALDREILLQAQPHDGAPRPVQVRIETASGAFTGAYVATVQPPATVPGEAAGWAASFQLLSENGALGFFDLNLAAGRAQFSPAWKRLLGYAPSELADTLETWQELVHPDDSAAAPDKI